ncbi:helix-turn-helix transcriptional regulator [Pleomorphovibrio marinus]|uniref:helix-turn-helix transcriptional regulator n=1 Tax=Pleomorphovibrio marinus TaxID=2164132 RepID=UPI000E0C53CD|nr:AraC family transcriptional regulator [Pleomorphovibrio marinus]
MNLSLISFENTSTVDIEGQSPNYPNHDPVMEQKLAFQDPSLGSIDCRLIATPNVSLLSGIIQLRQSVRLKTATPDNSINFPFMLEGSIVSHFYNFPKKQQLPQNSHNAIHLVHTEGEHYLPVGKLHTFHINVGSTYFYDNFISEDKITDRFKNGIATRNSTVASNQPGFIHHEMKNTIKHMLENPYQGAMKRMFLEIKSLELITMQIHQLCNLSLRPLPMGAKNKELAFGVKEFLEQQFLAAWTLEELARKFGTNIQTLKTSFKATFGMSIFSYYQQLRMEFAKHMLLEQKHPILEISEWLGYSHQNHFSTAFKKHFGFSPSATKPPR